MAPANGELTVKSSANGLSKRTQVILGGATAVGFAGIAFAYMQPSVEMVPAAPPVTPPVVGVAAAPSVSNPVASVSPVAVAATPTSIGGNNVPAPIAATIPADSADPLAEMDTLRGQIEKAKLKAELAKLQAQERDAASPVSSPSSMAGALPSSPAATLPPMPIFPVGGGQMAPSLDMPPLPPGRGGYPSARTQGSGAKGLQFLEAWGSGNDIQARIETSAGERIVKVGDAVNGGRVANITGNALTIRDAKGGVRTYN